MRRAILVVTLLMAAASSVAADVLRLDELPRADGNVIITATRCEQPGVICAEVLIGRNREVVRLGRGGCIRGPFTVYGSDGKTLLDLDAGMTLPEGCRSAFQ